MASGLTPSRGGSPSFTHHTPVGHEPRGFGVMRILPLTLAVAFTGCASSVAADPVPEQDAVPLTYNPCQTSTLNLARDVVSAYEREADQTLDELIYLCGAVAGAEATGTRAEQATTLCHLAADNILYHRRIGTLVTEAPAATCTLSLASKRSCQYFRCKARKRYPEVCRNGVMTSTTCTIGGEGSLEGGRIADPRCDLLCIVQSSVLSDCTLPDIRFSYSGEESFLVTMQTYMPALYALQQKADSLFRFAYNLPGTLRELTVACPGDLVDRSARALDVVSDCLVPVAEAIIVSE